MARLDPIDGRVESATKVKCGSSRRRAGWAMRLGLLCGLLLIFAPGRIEAQIQVTNLGSNFSTSTSTTIASFTVPSSGLPAGDTYFIVGVSCGGGSSSNASACTNNTPGNFVWGGSATGAWTQIGSRTSTDYRAVEIWQLKGPSGTGTLKVTATNAANVVAGVLFVAGVATSSPFGTFASSGGINNNVNPINQSVASTAGDLVVAVGGFWQTMCGSGTPSCTPSAQATGEVTQWQLKTSTSTQNVVGLGGTALPAVASQTMGWAVSSTSQSWSIAAVPVHPLPASGRKGQTIVGRLDPIRGTVVPETRVN
jgi:hypothetical protein